MKKILEYLEQLELSELEAKLYLTLLETGPIPVRELAEIIGVKRTTAYMPLEMLVEKGLVMKLVKGSRKLVAANEPEEHLQHLVERKLEKAKEIKEQFPQILTTITSSLPQRKDVGEAEIRHYKGRQGVKKIYEEALKAKELRSYVNIEEVLSVFPENAQLFDEAINHNPEMKMFEIVEDSLRTRERIATANKKGGRYLYKILPGNMRVQATDILIYDDKVSFINLKDKIDGVILHNSDLYSNFKLLFDFTWKVLPEIDHGKK